MIGLAASPRGLDSTCGEVNGVNCSNFSVRR
jgi:hypothetical protein